MSAGPLAGLRVLDLTRILAGPTATQLLGDYGADIFKIERPGVGDDTRRWGPPFLGDDGDSMESAYYLSSNRNKKSVAVDIASSDGQAIVRELATSCDVLIENFKVGGLKNYGLAYDDLKASNPGLIYCSITGFGQTGPNAHKPGYDLMAQGFSGIMSLTGDPGGEPMRVGVGIADVMTGMYATTAILAALRHRDQSGEGQHIDLGLVDCTIAWLINAGSNYLVSGREPERLGNQHPNIVPYQVFEVADGHLILAVGNDDQYRRFCSIIGRADLETDPRFASNAQRLLHRDVLIDLLVPLLKQEKRDELIARLEAEGIPCGPIHSVRDALASDQVGARDMRISMPHPLAPNGSVELLGNPVRFSETPVTYRYAPPTCGADTEEVLADLAARRKSSQ